MSTINKIIPVSIALVWTATPESSQETKKVDLSAPKDLKNFSALTSTAPNARKESSDQDSSTTIPEEIQDLRILDCTECFDKDSQIQALKKSKNDVEREATTRNNKIKLLEKTITSMESTLKRSKNDIKKEVTAKKYEIKVFEKERKDFEKKITSMESKIQDFKTEVDSKNSELRVLMETNVLSNMEIEKVKQDLKAKVESKNSELKAVREDANASKNEYEMKALGKDKTIKALRTLKTSKMEECENKSKVLESKVVSLKSKVKAIEKSNDSTKNELRRMKQILANEVFQFDTINQDLASLCDLDIEKLVKKYKEQILMSKKSDIKSENIAECFKDAKIKLKLQTEQRALHEKEFEKILNILKIPEGSRNYTDILPKITELFQLHEQNETEHISNGLSLIESVTRQE